MKHIDVLHYLKQTNWEAAAAPLLSMYGYLVRTAVLEYGMEAYFPGSEHAVGSHQKMQNRCLRLCIDAVKSRPIVCLQNQYLIQ